ncbi:hypothetical protein EV421DRAFT_1195331 [Armillaria borealis]|uniref:Uncharacterized protein n=1 Tax=Armillaria borealis TaxID=47425 RepID=A0AA39MYU1_9AGAR|nr:hypothetical protein EV421DRAFT_1195331 [Armillaria borealis]
MFPQDGLATASTFESLVTAPISRHYGNFWSAYPRRHGLSGLQVACESGASTNLVVPTNLLDQVFSLVGNGLCLEMVTCVSCRSVSKRIFSIRALTTVCGSASCLFKGGIRSANCGCRVNFPRKLGKNFEYISFNKHFNSLCRPLNLIPSLRCLFAPPRKPLSKLYLSKSYLGISLRMMKSFVKILHRLFACRLIVFRMPCATTHTVDLFLNSDLKQKVPTHLSLPHP